MKLIDSHCHLNYDYTPKSAADLVREAGENGVEILMTIGVDFESYPEVERISSQFPNVFHSVGLHPHEADRWTPENAETIRIAARHPKCRAIGEIGLDYHYDHSDRGVQQRVVREQLALALELKLPVVIHSREGEADLLPALQGYARAVPKGEPIGVIHCFTGTREFGAACIAEGFNVSFSGILTFKNAEDLRVCAREFPLSHLMVETDSPYLAPIPYRGKKCEPFMVKQTALKIAELKGITLEEVAEETTANTRRLFRLPTFL